MPVFALAIPVIHSSGGWIAYAGVGYLANTLSSTWIGAFILGNSTLLSGFGLVSAAGVASATGLLTGLGTTAAAGIGQALTTVGLGGLASWLGIAPVATFLGLTPVGWAIAGTAALGGGVLALFTRGQMRRINEERANGGLQPTSPKKIIREIRDFERAAMRELLSELEEEGAQVKVGHGNDDAIIYDSSYKLGRLKYVVNADGSEEIVFVSRFGRKTRVFLIKPAEPDGTLA